MVYAKKIKCRLQLVYEDVTAYIDDLIIINKNYEDQLNKTKLGSKNLKAAAFKINAEKSFFARDY